MSPPREEKARIYMEKRRSPRLEVYLPVEYHVAKAGPVKRKASGLSRDIGTGGLGLLLKRKVAEGTVLAMGIHMPGGVGRIKLKGEVVLCQRNTKSPESAYRWRAGMKFLKIQTQASAVLGQIIAMYSLGEPKRRRRS